MPEVKKYVIREPYLNLDCGLGEAPFWDKERDTLRFVDIVKEKLHTVKLSEGPSSHRQWDLRYSIGTTADIEGNDKEFIFGGKGGYGVFNKETGEHRIIKEMWTDAERKEDNGGKAGKGRTVEERMRSNDGAVDSRGRFYVGAMNDQAVVGHGNFTDEGILFRLDPDLSIHRIKEGITIPNGTSWTPDNTTMFFTDSPSGTIMAYPYNAETGEPSPNGQPFFTCPYEGGVPDGHCQDEEGHLWVACWGTGKVLRVNPQGEVVAEVEVPTRCVTCPELCGTRLFITTAAEEAPEDYPDSKEHQGALFAIDVGVKGSPRNKFAGKV